jgi:hypothetical protein
MEETRNSPRRRNNLAFKTYDVGLYASMTVQSTQMDYWLQR